MKKLPILLLILVAIVASGFVFQKQLITHLKIILFITEEFPQIPIKPLGLLTSNPEHKKVELETSNGKAVADLYMPNQVLRLPSYFDRLSTNPERSRMGSIAQDKAAALILAMGIKTSEDDKPLLYHFADSMARLGYVTFWPRLEALDIGQSLPEEPETFIESFKYLASLPQTDSERITFVGFSVGSSTTFVAASDPEIADKIHALVFFGGQYDLFEYLNNLASKTYKINGQVVEWEVADDARSHAKGLLEVKEATQTAKIFEESDVEIIKNIIYNAPTKEKERLKRYSPKEYVGAFKARIFILHDKSDIYVPYVESIKLNQTVKDKVNAFVISDLFEHVQPNRPIKFGELAKLYGFLYKVLSLI